MVGVFQSRAEFKFPPEMEEIVCPKERVWLKTVVMLVVCYNDIGFRQIRVRWHE